MKAISVDTCILPADGQGEGARGCAENESEILDAICDMRQMPVFDFESDHVVEGLLSDGSKYKADMADIMIAHAAEAAGCESGITFDKGAAKLTFFNLLK